MERTYETVEAERKRLTELLAALPRTSHQHRVEHLREMAKTNPRIAEFLDDIDRAAYEAYCSERGERP